MRVVMIGAAALMLVCGCAHKSSILMERPMRGLLVAASDVGHPLYRLWDPGTQASTQEQITVRVTATTQEYLTSFFGNKRIFGEYAGKNPFFPEQLVFYIHISNDGTERVFINPAEFVLIDDRGNQYTPLNVDYVTALAEYQSPVATTTRGILENASPGYFGFSVPVGRMFVTKPQDRFALVKESSLQTGYLYPGVLHDGFLSFWNPSTQATKLRLVVGNIKTGFDSSDQPTKSLDFPFQFHLVKP